MVEHRYHLVDTSHPELRTLAKLPKEEVHRIVRQEHSKPVVAISERAFRKALAAGWW